MKKKILLFLAIGAGVILIGGGAFLEITNSPNFCASCHNMKPYIDSWKSSSHNMVNCTVCHYEPGFKNYLVGKIKDGQAHFVIFITGKARGRYHAEIADSSCLQCHPKESLKEPKEFKGILFYHANHLEQMRRNKKLRCVTCHGQIVQGEHVTVDVRDCFICHFKQDAEGNRDPVLSNCKTCHKEVPEEIPINGRKFPHGRYFEDGTKCTTCHVGIITGRGEVDYDRCMECHAEKEKVLKSLIKTKYTTESYHLNHVTNHKVECWRCHQMIEHKIVRNPTSVEFQKNCTVCHTEEQHRGPRQMFAGTGGVGVPDRPSKMFLANVDCASCHVKEATGKYGSRATDVAYLSLGEACNKCHGDGYNRMLYQWKKILADQENATSARQLAAEGLLLKVDQKTAGDDAYRQASKLIDDAGRNLSFVRVGRGHHNIEYALDLLRAARMMDEDAMALLDKTHKKVEEPPPITGCTQLCHGDIETKKVPFGGVEYPHKKHVTELGFSCTECHGDMSAHGETTLANCADCHHGTGQGKVACADCHRPIAELIAGKGVEGAADHPDVMGTQIECKDCHTQTIAGVKTTADEIAKTCANCHEPGFEKKIGEWTAVLKKEQEDQKARIEVIRMEVNDRQIGGRNRTLLSNLLLRIDKNTALVEGRKGLHNFEYAQAALGVNRQLIASADRLMKTGEAKTEQ